jgi:hypothetical protein
MQNDGKLDVERVEQLDAIGFEWDPNNDAWVRQFAYLQEFRKEHPDRWLLRREEYPEGNKLGMWCSNKRKGKKDGKLDLERVEQLDAIGFEWDPIDDAWERQFAYLQEFRKEYPRWPKATEEYPDGNKLGWWCGTQRQVQKVGKLDAEWVEQLERIGFEWDPINDEWNRQFEYLQEFRNKYSDRWPLQREEYPEGNKLGTWCSNQRKAQNDGKISVDRFEKLKGIGFEWDPNNDAWQRQLVYLLKFRKECPDRWPLRREEYPEGNKLGSWCGMQRQAHKVGKLEAEWVEQLERIGFEWDPINDEWNRQFAYLQEFRKNQPDRWPLQIEEFPEGNKLGYWYCRQRKVYKNGKLEAEKTLKLAAIGFIIVLKNN